MKAALDLHEKGEQRYGPLGARVYSWTSRVRKNTYGYVIRDILSQHPTSVLDIGCGTGDVLRQLAAFDAELECYGVDPSPAMLRIATRNIAEAAHRQGDRSSLEERIHLSLGSSRCIPFDKEFDLIFSTYSFHEWTDREHSIAPILGRLKVGGAFAVYEYERDSVPTFFKLLFGRYMLSRNEIESIQLEGAEKVVDASNGLVAIKFKSHTRHAPVPP